MTSALQDQHFRTLGIEPGATEIEIKAAFKSLALKHHPDKGGDAEKFKEVRAKPHPICSSHEKLTRSPGQIRHAYGVLTGVRIPVSSLLWAATDDRGMETAGEGCPNRHSGVHCILIRLHSNVQSLLPLPLHHMQQTAILVQMWMVGAPARELSSSHQSRARPDRTGRGYRSDPSASSSGPWSGHRDRSAREAVATEHASARRAR